MAEADAILRAQTSTLNPKLEPMQGVLRRPLAVEQARPLLDPGRSLPASPPSPALSQSMWEPAPTPPRADWTPHRVSVNALSAPAAALLGPSREPRAGPRRTCWRQPVTRDVAHVC